MDGTNRTDGMGLDFFTPLCYEHHSAILIIPHTFIMVYFANFDERLGDILFVSSQVNIHKKGEFS